MPRFARCPALVTARLASSADSSNSGPDSLVAFSISTVRPITRNMVIGRTSARRMGARRNGRVMRDGSSEGSSQVDTKVVHIRRDEKKALRGKCVSAIGWMSGQRADACKWSTSRGSQYSLSSQPTSMPMVETMTKARPPQTPYCPYLPMTVANTSSKLGTFRYLRRQGKCGRCADCSPCKVHDNDMAGRR